MLTIAELEEKLKRGYEITTTYNDDHYESVLSFREHPYIKSPCEKIEMTHILRNFQMITDKLLEPMTECKISYDFDENQYQSDIIKNTNGKSYCENNQKETLISVLGNSLVDSLIILDSRINIENQIEKYK